MVVRRAWHRIRPRRIGVSRGQFLAAPQGASMKPIRVAWLLLAIALVLQWALPASLAARSEYVLRNGARYYLRTAPVDPADAFRGRYVALQFADIEVELPAYRKSVAEGK